jgi:hypothetical protein
LVFFEKIKGLRYIQGRKSRESGLLEFGRSAGKLQGLLEFLGYPVYEVNPATWRKGVFGKSTADKYLAIDKCMELFPYVDLFPGRRIRAHDGIAEAVFIAFFGAKEKWGSKKDFLKE